jgi:hypothetical protein
MAIETQIQYYFGMDATGTCFGIASDLVEPESSKLPPLVERALELNEGIRSSRFEGLFGDIVGYWLNSSFGPHEDIKEVCQTFLEEELTLAILAERTSLGLIDWERINNDAVLEIKELLNRPLRETIAIIEKASDLLEGMAEDLEWADYWEGGDDKEEAGNYIPFYDDALSARFKKQLAIAGIFTHTQYDCLEPDQIKAIKQIKVPRAFRLPSHFDEFLSTLEKLNITPSFSKK